MAATAAPVVTPTANHFATRFKRTRNVPPCATAVAVSRCSEGIAPARTRRRHCIYIFIGEVLVMGDGGNCRSGRQLQRQTILRLALNAQEMFRRAQPLWLSRCSEGIAPARTRRRHCIYIFIGEVLV